MTFFAKHKLLTAVGGIILAMIIVYVAVKAPEETGIQTERVERTNVRQVVEETGVVKAAQAADLSFEQAGRIDTIFVKKGDTVAAGAPLIMLDRSTQEAELASARAELAIEESTLVQLLANARSGATQGSKLAFTEQQQAALIENAYRTLLSSGLAPYTLETAVTAAAPAISGRYTGPEGQYKIIIGRPSVTASTYELRTFGIEKYGPMTISETSTTPLGSYGLLISFPDALSAYHDTVWYVDIPNKNASSYTTNLNAYIAAKETSGVASVQTGASTEDIAVQEARVDRARAAVIAAEVRLARRTLRAPFAGIVTRLPVARGETAAAGAPALSLISESRYEISVDIPEADIAEITVGDSADVIFDAYDDYVFRAHVTFVTPSARIDNGVATFEVVLQFDAPDPRIRAGLSADVAILAAERAGVLAIPNRAVIEPSQTERFVRTIRDGVLVEVSIIAGIRGSEGTTEVISGLSEGEEIVIFISEEKLKELTRGK